MGTRIYIITEKKSGAASLVEATNQSQALRHITSNAYEIAPVKPLELASLMSQGVMVQKAGEEPGEVAGS